MSADEQALLLGVARFLQQPLKEQIVEMAMNASGIRDTVRVLHVSTNTVMTELKKRNLNLNR